MEFSDVEVLAANALVLLCRVRGKIVGVSPLRILPGTTIARTGDRGILVLDRELACELGLI
jgi:hypothetical protein